MTTADLRQIVAAHAKWLRGEAGGARANLARADLTGAYLTGANLADADLTGACLTDADLTGAYLTDADLTGAYLTGAYLARADLTGANLTGANLAGANLTGADLADANLTGAYLTGADLADANLTGANLAPIRDDVYAVVSTSTAEVPGLLAAVREGRIDGSAYTGDCACLVGTIANLRHCPYTEIPGLRPDGSRPAERFFMLIRRGDTPATNPASAIVEGWIASWLEAHQAQAVTP